MEEAKQVEPIEIVEINEPTEPIEETKIYEFRKIGAEDIFTMVKIISAIGINKFAKCFKNEEMQGLMADLKDKKEVSRDVISIVGGAGIFMEVAQIVLEGMENCKDSIYKILSDTSNLSLDEVKGLDGVTFLEMIIDFIKKEEFVDFIKVASKFAK